VLSTLTEQQNLAFSPEAARVFLQLPIYRLAPLLLLRVLRRPLFASACTHPDDSATTQRSTASDAAGALHTQRERRLHLRTVELRDFSFFSAPPDLRVEVL